MTPIAETRPEKGTAETEPETTDEAVPKEHEAPHERETKRRLKFALAVRRGTMIAAAMGALMLGSFALAGFYSWQLNERDRLQAASEAAEATARDYAVTLTTVDSGDLDENFEAVLDGATGDFKDTYAESSEMLRQLLVDNNASATGTVVASGIQSATPDRVEVLLFVDQSVRNTQNPQPRIDRSRIVMTMENVDGRWLAGEVELP
ncbi:hypothetical protein IU449_14325 [Nocardia higoensis]|uniref:Mce-associated membrane protein n=1 Tax=Nocardia higoensis TaxID=228599 RepID=A0ABS0DG90_9NOCA|nr:hypothetical protein [Nocardia higoensis]MBF6355708.1 hypothetical protein [Nocardia higoensis]